MVELAKEFRELWDVATLAEKKEFFPLLTNSISIYPERKMAEISLSHNYCTAKHLLNPKNGEFFLSDGRGDTKQPEGMIAPIRLAVHFKHWKPMCA